MIFLVLGLGSGVWGVYECMMDMMVGTLLINSYDFGSPRVHSGEASCWLEDFREDEVGLVGRQASGSLFMIW